MSRFYMTSVNSRGNSVSAAGRSSGQDVHLRGWNTGVQVDARPKPLDPGHDFFVVGVTGGSNNPYPRELLTIQETAEGDTIVTLSDWLYRAVSAAYQTANVATEVFA